MTTTTPSRLSTRFDPSEFSPGDTESVRHLLNLFRSETKPPALVDEDGNRTELPRPIYELLVRVASALQEGKVISLAAEVSSDHHVPLENLWNSDTYRARVHLVNQPVPQR